MNATINDKGRIEISVCDMLKSMSPENKRSIIDSLACDESILDDVCAQLIEGWTEAGSHGSKGAVSAFPSCAINKARRKIAASASVIASQEIADLRTALIHAKELEAEYMDAYFRMYHAWGNNVPMPRGPQFGVRKSDVKYVVVEVKSEGTVGQ